MRIVWAFEYQAAFNAQELNSAGARLLHAAACLVLEL